MKRILVPCDFSDPAVQAFKFAAQIASQSKGQITLLNVVEIPVMHDTVLMPVLSFEEAFLKDAKEKAEKNFLKMKERWAKEVKVDYQVVYGATANTIREVAEEIKADVIVMGTHGASGLKEWVIGSNAEKIVRTSSIPVIAIKKQVKGDIKNIVFPITPSLDDENLFQRVKALQYFLKATLHLLFVNTPGVFLRDNVSKPQMEALAKRLLLKDYRIHVYNDLSEEEGIRNFTTEVKADMVALGTHGRRGLNHLLTGSIAEDIVNHLDCPIWTYKMA
ncbi:MAG: universal stress protein [Cyclobacteriaceae bacterium]|nr:universal stress protein [Cyclobacteriaceae bacterium]